ncbi:uncharacterized protein LOC141601697 [Silene latifolia]|uniref:uncharacterized protein LOC141601697 n=1 Tax=Silene latifolia TaxID=37657 RepID=UPI003D771B23
MRQRRWIELIRDYDMGIVYHEGKTNVVADALSRKSVYALCTTMSRVKLHEEVKRMGICMIRKGDSIGDLTIEPELYAEIREKFSGRWCVPDNDELKKNIVVEAYSTPYSVHPGGDKLYKDLKKTFWWPKMKKEVAEFVGRFISKFWHELQSLMGTQLKMSTTFYPVIDGQSERNIQTLEDMLRAYVMEFVDHRKRD